jgi:hypothetical protein
MSRAHRRLILPKLRSWWGDEFDQSLGVGRLIRVDTTDSVDIARVVATIQAAIKS